MGFKIQLNEHAVNKRSRMIDRLLMGFSFFMSYSLHKSIWWALLAGIFPFYYIPYWITTYTPLIPWCAS